MQQWNPSIIDVTELHKFFSITNDPDRTEFLHTEFHTKLQTQCLTIHPLHRYLMPFYTQWLYMAVSTQNQYKFKPIDHFFINSTCHELQKSNKQFLNQSTNVCIIWNKTMTCKLLLARYSSSVALCKLPKGSQAETPALYSQSHTLYNSQSPLHAFEA